MKNIYRTINQKKGNYPSRFYSILILIGIIIFTVQPSYAQTHKTEYRTLRELKVEKPKVMERPKISPAEYEVHKNGGFKSPFRHPIAKIPLVESNTAFQELISTIEGGKLPDEEDVIIEKLLNSLQYEYNRPKNKNKPFEIYSELFECPWNKEKRLLHIGLNALALDSISVLTDGNIPMAEEVNINVEFNPAYVMDYRLVGYEDHLPNLLSYQIDPMTNSTVWTGQSLTALYEFTPTQNNFAETDLNLLYQNRNKKLENNNELATARIFYRPPSGRKVWDLKSKILRRLKSTYTIEEKTFLAVAIAEVSLILKESPYRNEASLKRVIDMLKSFEEPKDEDTEGRKLSQDGVQLLELVQALQKMEIKGK